MNLAELHQLKALLKRLESERMLIFQAAALLDVIGCVDDKIREKQLEQEKPK